MPKRAVRGTGDRIRGAPDRSSTLGRPAAPRERLDAPYAPAAPHDDTRRIDLFLPTGEGLPATPPAAQSVTINPL